MKISNIVIFASGSGSNAENIMRYFQDITEQNVAAVFSNKRDAGVLKRAKYYNVPTEVLQNKAFNSPADLVIEKLEQYGADYIVLAGFLRKIPPELVHAYPERIINIHPALLPNYGGKGMYGARVHQAVWENADQYSGISIHSIDEVYDGGELIAQFKTDISDCNSPEEIEDKVRKLEIQYFPQTIQKYIQKH